MPRPLDYLLAESTRSLLRYEERGAFRRDVPYREVWRLKARGVISDQLPVVSVRAWFWTMVGAVLSRGLRGREGWTAGNWIDGILTTDEVAWAELRQSGDACVMAGLAIWSDAQVTTAWVEPFAGVVRVSRTVRGPASYELHFGDATQALGLVRYRQVRSHDYGAAPPATWRYSVVRDWPSSSGAR